MFRLAFLILMLGMLSCKSQKKHNVTDSGNNELTLLVEDGYSGVEEFESMVVRDQKTLNSFFAKINRTRKPGIPVPKVDFAKEMVIVVCAGEQEGIEMPKLLKASENEKEIIFAVENVNPPKKKDNSLISSPFRVYKMPISNKKVIFNR